MSGRKQDECAHQGGVVGCRITPGHPARSLKAVAPGELLTELGADFCLLLKPRPQKCAPASPPTRSRVSAALLSRDTGDRRASLGALG